MHICAAIVSVRARVARGYRVHSPGSGVLYIVCYSQLANLSVLFEAVFWPGSVDCNQVVVFPLYLCSEELT